MKIGEQIRYFRRKNAYSMEELGKVLGVSRQTIYRYETGVIENIPMTKIKKMAALFGVSAGVLCGYVDAVFAYEGVLPLNKKRLPLLGEIACGEPIYADGCAQSSVLIGEDIHADFCLRAKGDSMVGARIYDGDIVFVQATSSVENGEIGVVVISDEATLKRVYYYPEREKLLLLPENPAYEPLVYVGAELETVKIIGKAVGLSGRIK